VRLTLKLLAIIMVVTTAVLLIDSVIMVRRQVDIYRSDLERDAARVAQIMQEILPRVAAAAGPEFARTLLSDAHTFPGTMRWIPLEPPDPADAAALDPDQVDALSRGELVTLRTNRDGQSVLLTYAPVELDSGTWGALELAEDLTALDRFASDAAWRMIILVAILALTCGCIGTLSGIWLVGHPLIRLRHKAERIGQGDLTGPLHLRGKDELAGFARTLNQVCDQLQEANEALAREVEAHVSALEQVRHLDRLGTVGRLASGVAHELGTPINVIAGRARMITQAQPEDADEIVQHARIIGEQTDRITAIIRQLLTFARNQPKPREQLDPRSLVDETVALLTPLARKRDVTLRIDDDGRCGRAHLGRSEMQQVLTNLIVNAIQASESGGQVLVRAHSETRDSPASSIGLRRRHCLCFDVEDEGGGISAEDLERIFDPFFTTKEIGQGTGLGLSIAHGLVREAGGWIDVQTVVGKGSCFTVCLPQEESA
jgi:signal transduction histidine kinase